MILSQPEIREAVSKGEIRFDPPLLERQWHEASVDLRLGVQVHEVDPQKGAEILSRACWLQPGWHGQITLEIRNSGPFNIELTPGEDMPCQVTFFRLTSELTDDIAYGARPTDVFQNQANPLPVKNSR